MSNRDDIKQKALRAAVAVTMSASFATGCAEDTTDVGDTGWSVDATADASEDTSADATGDTAGDAPEDTTNDTVADTSDTTVADADSATCSDTLDDQCPEMCNSGNDADCCEQSGGIWSAGACAVPGPFVPPSMRA